jgi:transcriptional regulator with XRE-family HTH domain
MPDDKVNVSLPELTTLLKSLNKSLGWKATDMAKWMNKDDAEISRILNGRIRPQNETLRFFARRYQDAGLEGITADMLITAKERGGNQGKGLFEISARWLRLVSMVVSMGSQFEDIMYDRWMRDIHETTFLIYQQRNQEYPSTDEERS